MARQFRRSFGSGGKVRRQTQWDATNQWTSQPFTAPGESFVLAFTEFNQVITVGPVSPPTPLTIIRTIVDWAITDFVPGSFFAAIGMCLVTQDALDQALLGIKSIPTPISDSSSDAWLLHNAIAGVKRDITTGSVADGYNLVGRIESKAMRKIDDGFQVVLVGERDAGLGGTNGTDFTLTTTIRALVKVS